MSQVLFSLLRTFSDVIISMGMSSPIPKTSLFLSEKGGIVFFQAVRHNRGHKSHLDVKHLQVVTLSDTGEIISFSVH